MKSIKEIFKKLEKKSVKPRAGSLRRYIQIIKLYPDSSRKREDLKKQIQK